MRERGPPRGQMTPHRNGVTLRSRRFRARSDGRIASGPELCRLRIAALTIRLRTDDERNALERLKDVIGTGTASRAILRAVREWPDLAGELAAERRRVEDLRTVLLAIVAAGAGLAGAQAHPRNALKAATSTLVTE